VEATLLREWERFFPWATVVEELDEKDRRFWFRLREAIVRDHQSFSKLVAAVTDGLTDDLASEIRDREERRKADLRERRVKREGRERRKEKRLDQELKERNRFLLLITAGFVVAPLLLAVGALLDAPVAYLGSLLGLLSSGGGLVKLRGLDRRGPGEPNP
jgi:hypothetical protein